MIIPTEENIFSNKKLIIDIKKLLPKITNISLREDYLGLYIYIKIPIVYHKYIEKLDSVMPWLEKPRFHIHYTNIFCRSDSVDKNMEMIIDNLSKLDWMMSMYITLDDLYINGCVYPLLLFINYIRCYKTVLPHIEGIFGLEFISDFKSIEKKILTEIKNKIPNLQFIIANEKRENSNFVVNRKYEFCLRS